MENNQVKCYFNINVFKTIITFYLDIRNWSTKSMFTATDPYYTYIFMFCFPRLFF